ncbi:MAG: hypothetical protein IPP37_14185 [Saprospiraceae bacterium]|nr:hypothetical protein [Saprospiraceae bacterium]
MGISPRFEYKPLFGFNSGYRADDDFNFMIPSGFTILSDPWPTCIFLPFLIPTKLCGRAEYGQNSAMARLSFTELQKAVAVWFLSVIKAPRTTNIAIAVR